MTRSASARRATLPAVLALAFVTLVGCTADRHTYLSTTSAPKSLSVSYVDTGETAWSYDLPVGQRLTLELNREGQIDGFSVPNRPADSMQWYTTPASENLDASGHPSKGKAIDSGTVAFNGQPIQINMAVRPAEAYAPLAPAPAAVPAPPAVEEPPAMEAEPVVEEPALDATDETMEEAAEEAGDLMEEAADGVEDAGDAAEEAVPDMSK